MVSIVLPIYNEEKRLKEGLDKIFEFLKDFKDSFEVIVVNDGSSDKSGQILEKLRREYNFKFLEHKTNLGKGAAIKTGIEHSRGELILFTDIDLSVPIETLNDYLRLLDSQTDIIIGTRAHKDSKILTRQSFTREFMGGVFTKIVNLVLWVGASDFTCGFKLFRREAALKVFGRQLTKRWAFDAESLFLAKKFGFKIKESSVLWEHKEGSKVRFPADIVETFMSLIKIRVNDFLGKYNL